MQREVEIDRREQEEMKNARATGSSTNMRNKRYPAAMSSISSLLSVPSSNASGRRPGSQRLSGTSPNSGTVNGRRSTASKGGVTDA